MREQQAARHLQEHEPDLLEWRELAPVLDAAIARLPEKFRTLFVLCYLQNKSVREIAKQQNLPVGTVASRLARARDQLMRKLVRQGVTLSTASLAVVLSDSQASALASQTLIGGTIQASRLMAAGTGITGLFPQSTTRLLRGGIHMTMLAHIKQLAGILAVAAAGVCLLAYSSMAIVGANPNANGEHRPALDDSKPTPVAAQNASEKPGDQAGKLKPVPFLSLQRSPTDGYRLGPGDTLGLVIDGILGDSKQVVPVQQGGNSNTPPAMGYPMVVREDGTLPIPQIAPLKVAGMTVAEVEAALRRAYTDKPNQVVIPAAFNSIVTIMRKRTIRIVVIREDVAAENFGANQRPQIAYALPPRSNAQILDLPFGENDLLTVLAKTGGIPNSNSTNEVVIERNRTDPKAEGGKPRYVKQTLKIPLKLPANAPVPFTEDDITLQSGDIVAVPAREEPAAGQAK
jgi:hypothetical protein